MDKFKYLQDNFRKMRGWVGKRATFTYFEKREWDSIISIVAEEYAEARALNNVDMEAQVEEAMLDEAQAQAEGMQECYDL